MPDNRSKNILKSFKSYIQPKRFYEELAEYGYLEEFLKANLAAKFSNDFAFRNEMLEILYKLSPKVVPEIEILYLDKLCETLGFFLEYTRQWRNQKP